VTAVSRARPGYVHPDAREARGLPGPAPAGVAWPIAAAASA